MFKNRAAQVTFVKTPKNDSTESIKSEPRFTDAQIKKIESLGQRAFVCLVAAAVVLKSTDALCTIAINACPKH